MSKEDLQKYYSEEPLRKERVDFFTFYKKSQKAYAIRLFKKIFSHLMNSEGNLEGMEMTMNWEEVDSDYDPNIKWSRPFLSKNEKISNLNEITNYWDDARFGFGFDVRFAVNWTDKETPKEVAERQKTIESLRSCHTKQLLNMRINSRYQGTEKTVWFNPILYDILSTREHIPNKIKTKKIRQKKTKTKKNR